MATNERERNLFHRIFLLLLTTSIIYNFSEDQKRFDAENNKGISFLTFFSGNRLQLKFNTNVGNVIPQKTKNSVKTRTLILIILAISGDISSNPGPNQHQHASNKCNCRNQNLRPNSPDWMTDLSSHSKHIMIKLKNLQWSEVKKELHLKYLQQYKNSNIIPPGLNINKTPQIKYLKEHKKQIWENSLSNISKTLLDLLISQHSSDLKAINKQLKASKHELKEANDIINHKESVDNWLPNDKDSYFNFLDKQKEEKFNNHLSATKRTESNFGVHNNKPLKQKHPTNHRSK